LARSAAGAALGGGLRGDGRRSGGSGPAAGGVVRPGVGAGLPGLPPDAPPGAHRQRRPGAPAPLPALGRTLEALRSPTGRLVRTVVGPMVNHGGHGLHGGHGPASSPPPFPLDGGSIHEMAPVSMGPGGFGPPRGVVRLGPAPAALAED